MDSTENKANFGFNVKYTKSGKAQGHMTYVYRQNGLNYIVKSNALTGLAIDDAHGSFEGKCVVRIYDPAIGETIWNEGNYNFRVDIWDNGEPGSNDVFQIVVRDKNGVVWYSAGITPSGTLMGGNIAIHDERFKTK